LHGTGIEVISVLPYQLKTFVPNACSMAAR